jgi:AraC-like DNA-binding protein
VLPRFGMPEAGIVIAGSTLDAVRPGANLQVRAMAVAYLESQGPRPSRSRADETRRIVEALIRSSTCSVEEAARAMGIHARTLQRDLKLEGTTFEVIRDGVRRDLARQLLRDRSQSITQVSLQLHYATASAFTRSCRRWFRNSPSRVRELLSDAPRRPGVRKKRTPVQKNGRRQ